jgi:choice-of-anchor B domain-containing protein
MKKLVFLSIILAINQITAQVSTPINTRLRASLQKSDFAGITDGSNICGYSANGREYALYGHNKGMSIIDVTNPDVPSIIHTVPALNSRWREIKVYKNYAYVTTEAIGQGLQIVDMSGLPANIMVKTYSGGDSILTTITKVHALHIDTAKGNVYLFGGSSSYSDNVNSEGATVLSLKDPWNPKFIGRIAAPYIHDGYVNNDTLFAAQINNGTFSIIDFREKNNPITLSTTKTPTAFTHNTWISKDRKFIFTTDENAGSYLGAYDVSNPQIPVIVDKIRTAAKENAIIHNTHVLGNYAITSWYGEGVIITDVTRPQNMVNVGQYDTFNGSSTGSVGSWGVYPYLPSGNLIISNITGEFYIVTPTYKRACYLEGNVIDSITRQPLSNVSVKIGSSDMEKETVTKLTGDYYTGQVTNGTFQVTYSKAGFKPKTVSVALENGQITLKNIELVPIGLATLNINDKWKINAYPNPFNQTITIDYQLENSLEPKVLTISNVLGQVLYSQKLENTVDAGNPDIFGKGVVSINPNLVSGVYFVKIQAEKSTSRTLRIVRQ